MCCRKNSKRLKDLECNCQLLPTVQKLVEKYKFLIDSPPISPTVENKCKSSVSSKRNSMDQPTSSSIAVSPKKMRRKIKLNKDPCEYLTPQSNEFHEDLNSETTKTNGYSLDDEKYSIPSNDVDGFNHSKSVANYNYPSAQIKFPCAIQKSINSGNHILRIMNYSCPVHSKIKDNSEAYILEGFQENERSNSNSMFQLVGNAGVFGCSDNIIMRNSPKSDFRENAIIKKGDSSRSRRNVNTLRDSSDVMHELATTKWFRYSAVISALIIVLVSVTVYVRFKKSKKDNYLVILWLKNLFRYMNSFFKT